MKIVDFNEGEEKEIKERVEKQKIKRREVAQKKNTFLKEEKTRGKQRN